MHAFFVLKAYSDNQADEVWDVVVCFLVLDLCHRLPPTLFIEFSLLPETYGKYQLLEDYQIMEFEKEEPELQIRNFGELGNTHSFFC